MVAGIVKFRGNDYIRFSERICGIGQGLALQRTGLPSSSSVSMPIYSGSGVINDMRPEILVYPGYYVKRFQKLLSYAKDFASISLIETAFQLAWQGHAGQFRKSGEPYFEHPLAVAEIVAERGLGAEAIAAALCHDLIEDGKIAGKKINSEFIKEKLGGRVVQLVWGITELGKEQKFVGKKPSPAEIYKKWLKYGSKDLASIIIKLVDRLHNMRTLAYTDPATREEKARETLNIYAPIADRLGMWDIKRELEDLSFFYLEPEKYQEIAAKRAKIIEKSEEKVKSIVKELGDYLEPLSLKIEIILEKRFIYELYERVKKRKISLESLSHSDLYRINIVVPAQNDCHVIEGKIHEKYRPIQKEICHYIGDPRPNGHRFLHSYVNVGGFGRLLIQIRDCEMQESYHFGILSSILKNKEWYKKNLNWLKSLLNYFESEGIRGETLYEIYEMIAANTDPIIIYTPEGETVEAPSVSTALDYALSRGHLNINKIYVNGEEVPFDHALAADDSVKIEEEELSFPIPRWLLAVHTLRAAGRIKEFLINLGLKKQLKLGEETLDNAIADKYLYWVDVKDSFQMSEVIGYFSEKYKEKISQLRKGKVLDLGSIKAGGLTPEALQLLVGIGEIDVNEFALKFEEIDQTFLQEGSSQTAFVILFDMATDQIGLTEKFGKAFEQIGMNIVKHQSTANEDHSATMAYVFGLSSNMQQRQIENIVKIMGGQKTDSLRIKEEPTKFELTSWLKEHKVVI